MDKILFLYAPSRILKDIQIVLLIENHLLPFYLAENIRKNITAQ